MTDEKTTTEEALEALDSLAGYVALGDYQDTRAEALASIDIVRAELELLRAENRLMARQRSLARSALSEALNGLAEAQRSMLP